MSKSRRKLRAYVRPHLEELKAALKVFKDAEKAHGKAKTHWDYYFGTEGNPFIDPITLKKCEDWLTDKRNAEAKAREALANAGRGVRNAVIYFKNFLP